MKAFIYASGEGKRLLPFSAVRPKALLPVNNKAVIQYTLDSLEKTDLFDEIRISIYHLPEQFRFLIQSNLPSGIPVSTFLERRLEGLNSVLIKNSSFLNETFIIWPGDVISNINISEAVNLHEKSGKRVTSIHINNQSSGIFICEPEFLKQKPDEAFWKGENSVLPAENVHRLSVSGSFFDLNTPDDFFTASMTLADGNRNSPEFHNNGISNSVIGENVKIGSGTRITDSIILPNTRIGKKLTLSNVIVDGNIVYSIPQKYGFITPDKVLFDRIETDPVGVRVQRFLVNIADKVLSGIALLFLFPVFTLVALAIKLDSPGPVFYRSKRLLKPELLENKMNYLHFEREEKTGYMVFRTMVLNADKVVLSDEMSNKYEGGTFKKFENDPRITRVGRILRKTSLDELPLLWGVFKGDLSLVGIWALPTYEAEAMNKSFKVGELDLTEMAKVRFSGKLGLGGFWQSRGRSNLSAEERAVHDSYQAVISRFEFKNNMPFLNFLAHYFAVIKDTAFSVLLRKGAM